MPTNESVAENPPVRNHCPFARPPCARWASVSGRGWYFRLYGERRRRERGTKAMPLILDTVAFQKSLAALPVSTYEPGEIVLAAGSTTARLLVLRQGVVEVLREGTQIAQVSEPGAVFGELSALLDKPHTADVRALERSEFSVADAGALIAGDP